MEITIALDEGRLKNFLNSCTVSYHYFYYGTRKKEIEALLRKPDFRNIGHSYFDDKQKNKFAESYTDLIGTLGQKYNSVFWWATNTSAKNQFGSKVFENLYLYYLLVSFIKQNKYGNLLIINLPQNMSGFLVEYLKENGIRYQLLGRPSFPFWGSLKKFRSSLASYCIFVALTIRNIHVAHKYLKKKLDSHLEEKGNYYVIRTWFYQDTLKNTEYIDSFFGVLPSYLVKKGKKLLVIAGIMGEYEPIVERISRQKEYLIFPPELFQNYMDPLRALIEIIFHKVKIKGKVRLGDIDVTELVKNELDTELRSASGLSNYLNYYCVRNLLSRVKIENFIVIYENNAWERMCILALRKYSPGTHIVGYQHPPLFKAAVNMMISHYEKGIMPMPDKINTIGKINKQWLVEYGNYDSSLIFESCALRLEDIPFVAPARRKFSHKILLILGGIYDRTIDIINFVQRGLAETSAHKVIIRPHPALPLQEFANELEFNLNSSELFSISGNMSVIKDLQEADIVIYDATTLVFRALSMGVPVINIGLKEILSFDPLFQCPYLKWTVIKNEELSKTIEAIYRIPEDEFLQQQKEAQKYVQEYIYPCTEERLSEFIV